VIYAAREGYIEPFKVRLPRIVEERQPVLSAEEVNRVLEAALDTWRPVRNYAIVLTLLDSGLRRGELLNLEWSDINLETGRIIVRESKSRRHRTVFVSQKTLTHLNYYHAKWPGSPVFPLTPGGLVSLFKRLSKKSGIYVTCHAMRRSFATLSIRAGLPLPALQRIMGHRSIETTQRYIYLIDDDLEQAHTKHSPLSLL